MGATCPKCFNSAFKIFYDSMGKPVAKCVECGTETPFTKAAFGGQHFGQQTEEQTKEPPGQRKDPRHSSY